MNYLGIDYQIKNHPVLDPDYIPFGSWSQAFLKEASRPISIAVERNSNQVSVFHSFIRDEHYAEANARYVERLVKFLLWSIGGHRIYIAGCDQYAQTLKSAYQMHGARAFDADFMNTVFERPLEIVITDFEHFPEANEITRPIGGHLNGCRIGFDAGGSDRKVSAVIDGQTVFSEEVVWFPKQSENPQYQYDGIVSAFKAAASKMPRVDAIGVSSAGVFIGNSPMVSSLFIKVPSEFHENVKSIYDRAAKEIGENIPIVVANDGDVTALAGSISLNSGAVLGLAMGTSEAVGYVTSDGNVTGWFNELAFAPVDLNPAALKDEWSGDIGVGCKYFSQDAVIKLAPAADIQLNEHLSLAEKLKSVQGLVENGHPSARDIFKTIGAYLAHTVPLYASLYHIQHLLVLGRVASGVGGDIVVAECNRILADEYPELAKQISVTLPNESMRRVGQSIAAASLPVV